MLFSPEKAGYGLDPLVDAPKLCVNAILAISLVESQC